MQFGITNFAALNRHRIMHATKLCDCGRWQCHIKQAFFAGIPLKLRGGFNVPKDLTSGRMYDVLDCVPGDDIETFVVADDDGVKLVALAGLAEEGDINCDEPLTISQAELDEVCSKLQAHFDAKNLDDFKDEELVDGDDAPQVNTDIGKLREGFAHFWTQKPALGVGQVIVPDYKWSVHTQYVGDDTLCVVDAVNQNYRDPDSGELLDLVVMYYAGEYIYARVNSKRFKLAPQDQQINHKEGV